MAIFYSAAASLSGGRMTTHNLDEWRADVSVECNH